MAALGMDTTALTSHYRYGSPLRLGILFSLMIAGSLVATPASAYDPSAAAAGAYPSSASTNPFLQQRPPLSVPVKAMVERFLLRSRIDGEGRSNFRYDIDTLGQGMEVSLRLRF